MDAAEFDRALKLGLGRIILYLQKHPAAPHRAAILQACLHSLAWDIQIEGSRAEYMFDIIELTGEQAFYREHILAALATSGDDADASQLFALARRFAARGDEAARQAMYDKFIANRQDGINAGAEQLIFLDGISGFIFVADQFGKSLLAGKEDWLYGYLLGWLEDMYGEEAVRPAIERAREENPQVRAYLEAAAEVEAQRKKHTTSRMDTTEMPYSQIKAILAGRKDDPFDIETDIAVRRWSKHATQADLAQAAADLLLETDPKRLRTYLRIFWQRKFPLAVESLIEFVRHPEAKVAAQALAALKIIQHPAVRAFAFELMDTTSDRRSWAVDLLINNFQEGDHLILERFARTPLNSEEERWRLGHGILDFCEAHSNPESEERLMLALYEYNPCSHCRERIIDRLLALDRLPDWMAEECRYDVNLDIREKFALPE